MLSDVLDWGPVEVRPYALVHFPPSVQPRIVC
jgi:hypothetical protein